jgi:multiple sugar transport system ATP-binding protein
MARARSPRYIGSSISAIRNHVHLKLAAHSLVTLANPAQELKAGDQVCLEFDDPLYFDQAGKRIVVDELRRHA